MKRLAAKILVVDDTRLNIEIMKALLQNDYDIYTAMSGLKALQICQDENIDLILLDVEMPDLDGYETCSRLKSDSRTENIPVIFVTACGEVHEETKGLNLGAVDYIVKPISAPILKARVRNHVQLKRYHDSLIAANLKVRQLSNAVEQSPVSVVITDTDGLMVYVNPKFCELTGYSAEELLNRNPRILQSPVTPKSIYVEMWKTITTGQLWRGEFCNKKKTGELYWEAASINPLLDENGVISHFVCVKEDITQRKLAEAKLRELSLTDELTSLTNRRGFTLLAEQQIKISRRLHKGFTLFFADMDGLKSINDCLGHSTGDQALLDIAHLLKKSFRASDIVARLGGDEFACLSFDTRRQQVSATLLRLQDHITAANSGSTRPYKLSLSIGAAEYHPDKPCTLEELLHQADQLMYAEKRAKKDARQANPF